MLYTKKTLQKYWLILKYHRFPAIGIFLLTMMLAIMTAIKVERVYTVNSKIQLESPNKDLINSFTTNKSSNNNNQENTAQKNKKNTEVTPTISTEKLFEKLKVSDDYSESPNYNRFIKKLDIKNDSRTGIIDITYSGKDINSSKFVVDSVIESYKTEHTATSLSNIEDIKGNINQELALADKNRKEIASKLNNLLTKYDPNILESKPEYLTNKIKEIENNIASAQSEIQKIDSKINELKSKLGLNVNQDPASNQLSESPEQQKLLNQLQEIESQLIEERARFSEESPVIINLQQAKAKIEAQINNSNSSTQNYISVNQNNSSIPEITEQLVASEAEKKSWLTKIESWEIDKERYQKDKAIAPGIKQQYKELLTKQEKAQEQYDKLANKSQQLEILSGQNIANIKVITPAQVKNNLAFWNKEIIMASGIGLGFIFALAAVLALESKSPSLKTSEEMSQLSDSKVLAEIPNLRKSDFQIARRLQPVAPEKFVLEASYSVACEAYKIFYDNFELTNADQVVKLITVTSSIVAEGKSTFIANLAALVTQLGKKVLIIDANLQTPRQKEIWRIYTNLGLTDILKQEAEFNDIVQSPQLNLDVITAGSMVKNYLSLWESEQIQKFISYIKEKYDLVIFDTPAMDLSPDALKIGQVTDGIILVGRIGFTNPEKVLETTKLIEKYDQEILGLVVNEKFDN